MIIVYLREGALREALDRVYAHCSPSGRKIVVLIHPCVRIICRTDSVRVFEDLAKEIEYSDSL